MTLEMMPGMARSETCCVVLCVALGVTGACHGSRWCDVHEDVVGVTAEPGKALGVTTLDTSAGASWA